MFVPIRNRTKVIGILSIQSYELQAYDETDLATLQAQLTSVANSFSTSTTTRFRAAARS